MYLRPTQSGFVSQAVGIHTLEKIIPDLMAEAHFVGKFTLHSLRATCATRLFRKGVDEQLITEITGHSSNAVREYKRTSQEQKQQLSTILQCAVVPNKQVDSGFVADENFPIESCPAVPEKKKLVEIVSGDTTIRISF